LDGVTRLFTAYELRTAPDAAPLRAVIGIDPATPLRAANRRMWWNLGLIAVAFAALLFAADRFATLVVTRPVRALVGLAQRIGAGDFAARSGIDHGRGEIGRLAHALDRTAASLAEQESALRRGALDLRNAEAVHTALLDSSVDAFVHLDQNSRILEWSAASARLFGAAREEVLGRDFHELFASPADQAAYRRGLARFFATGELGVVNRVRQLTALRRDGTAFPIDIMVSAAQIDGAWHFFGFIRDVSERVRQERALREHRRDLLVAQNAARIAYARFTLGGTPENQRITWSDNAADVLGLAPSDLPLANDRYWALIHPDDRAMVRDAIDRGAGAHRLDVEYRIVRPDGSIGWLREIGESRTDAASDEVEVVEAIQDITEKKLAEEELRLSRQRLRDAQRQARLAYWREPLGGLGRIEWSEDVHAVLGVSPGRAPDLDRDYFELIHPDDRDRMRRTVRDRREGPEPEVSEYRVLRDDGTVGWIRQVVRVARDSATSVPMVFGTIQDVTEQKLVEERLRRSQEQLVEVQRRSRLTSWRYALGGGDAVEWADGAADVLGLPEDAVPRTHAASDALIHPDDRDRAQALRASLDSSDVPYELEYRMLRPDGSVAWLREFGQVLPADAGGTRWVAGTIQDVTELRRIEAERKELEARLDAFMQNAPFVMYVKDLSGRYVLTNPEHERVFGRPDRAVLGSRTGDLCPPAVAEALLEHDAAVLSTGQVSVRERSYEGYDRYAHVLAVKFPVRDPAGTIVAIGGFEIDVSERKRVELQLQQAQKMEAIGQLTGGLAHDFNNISGIVVGNLDLLRERVEGDPAATELVDEAFKAIMRGTELNRQLLAFARRQPLQPTVIDVNETVAAIARIIARTVGEAIRVDTVTQPDAWAVRVDVVPLESAVLNLAINARDAMPEGGAITIETRNVHIDEPYAAGHAEVTVGDYVMISVSDTGSGMPPEVFARAFEPFFTTKGAGKGTGLGLAMVHGFVKQSGGHVAIYSEVGRGTSVKLYLPRVERRADAGPAATTAARPDRAREGETILVVEDNEALRRVACRLLGDMGYATLEAGSGPAALEILRGGAAIDLLLTDIVMPGGMDGRGLAEQAQKLRPGLPVLFASGYTEAAASSLSSDFTGRFISKPYRRADLGRLVREVLDRRR
jgi:PAS domain S-box-containing protein